MTSQHILNTPVSRLTLLRITAQTYCKLQNLLGPLVMSTKALSSRACELSNINELEVDLKTKDPEFAAWAKGYIVNLRKLTRYCLSDDVGFLQGTNLQALWLVLMEVCLDLFVQSTVLVPRMEQNC